MEIFPLGAGIGMRRGDFLLYNTRPIKQANEEDKMAEDELTKEEQVLRMVKRVLTDVAKDTHVKPGLKHPLSDNTILGIRDCLALISARELELAKEHGRSMNKRPQFPDQKKQRVVVSIDSLKPDHKND